MPHIALPPDLPGIVSGFAFRPETAKPMRELAEVLLRGPAGLSGVALLDYVRAMSADTDRRMALLTQAIGRLFAVAEAYPELRATENFQQLQAQLADTEQKIAISRQVYNDAVLTYDNALETVPTNIVAGVFNFEPREYFEVEEPAVREAPRVQF